MCPGVKMRVLGVAAVAAGLVAPVLPSASARPAGCLATLRGVDLLTATVPQIDRALASHRFTSVQLTQAYLRRIRAFDHGAVKVNAIRAFTTDALKQAAASDARRRHHHLRGPLDGIPIILKDNVGTRDAPTTAGSIAFKGNIPKHEATIVTKLRSAGAVILAKTNLSEFANWVDLSMPNGYSSLGGQVVNPYNGGDPSGSSSGSGAGGAVGHGALAIGTETSGSILSPSDVESLVGIKPTVGLVSRYGVIPLAQSFDTAGPMARNVTDAALMLQTIAGRDPKDSPYDEAPGGPPLHPNYLAGLRSAALHGGALKGARLGYSPSEAQNDNVFARAVRGLRRAGATLVATDELSDTSLGGLIELGVIPNEFKYGINDYLAREAGPKVAVKSLTDIAVYNQQHPDKVKYGQNLILASDSTPGVYDEPSAIAARTATITAAREAIDHVLTGDQLDAYLTPGASYANIGAAAGYPTVIVPAGFHGSEPEGVGFLGSAWTEPTLLALAHGYEQASRRRLPPTKVNPELLSGAPCAGPEVCTIRKKTGESREGFRPGALNMMTGALVVLECEGPWPAGRLRALSFSFPGGAVSVARLAAVTQGTDATLDAKLDRLGEVLTHAGSVLVAFSGGADSAFLLAAATRALGSAAVVAATAESASLPRAELTAAADFAASLGVRHVVAATDEMSRPGYVANAGDRCYFCKAELLDVLRPIADSHDVAHVATGTNADDARAGFRPGIRAAAERGALTPLLDAGLTKDDVRRASRAWSLITWDKPAAACLSSRVAYGLEVTSQRLSRIERAEGALRHALTSAGIPVRDLRVRDLGERATVEVDNDLVDALAARPDLLAAVSGFDDVQVDSRGFRSGAMNELLDEPDRWR